MSGLSWTSDGAHTPLLDTSRETHPQIETEMGERERESEKGFGGRKLYFFFLSFLFVYEVLVAQGKR